PLPDAIDYCPRGRRRVAINQPLRKRQPVRWRARGQRMEEGRHSRRDYFVRLQKIAAAEHMSLTQFLALIQNQLRRAFGMLLPQFGNLRVRFPPFGNSRAPVAEDSLKLRWRAFVPRDCKYFADACGQRVGG